MIVELTQHIDVYVTQVDLYITDDVSICKVLPTALKGATLNWFMRLLPFSINCFSTLASHFGMSFAIS